MKHPLKKLLLVTTLAFTTAMLRADEIEDRPQNDEKPSFSGSNIKARTTGGSQFWADELVFHQWRIQRNVFTRHYRLLDEDNVRHAWGSWQACQDELERIKRQRSLPPMKGNVVVLVHGLGRGRQFMNNIARHLKSEGDYTIVNVEYPSTRADLGSHAAGLARVIEHLGEDVEEINFVAHSLGNLVVRHYLADQNDPENGRRPDPRIKRMVMLGPPNQGAAMARLFEDVPLFNVVLRGTGRQLASNFKEVAAHLGTPPCEFGILAGGRGDDAGWNPLIEGDDDRVVRVAETRLTGARDFRLLRLQHTQLARETQALQMTASFLKHGYFTSAKERQAIE